MITTINEFKNNIDKDFQDELDNHVLAFFIKYGKDYWDNRGSALEYLQNNDEDHSQDEYVDVLMDALKKAMQKHEGYADMPEATPIVLDKDTLEPIDSEEFEVDQIVDIITDQEEIKKLDEKILEVAGNSNNIARTDMNYKTVGRNDILWLTVMLKPRNKSTAYPLGEMGVVKVKVLQTFYGLNKLKQLKQTDKVY